MKKRRAHRLDRARRAPASWSARVRRRPPIRTRPSFLEFVLSREGQKLMQTPGRHIARGDLANEQADCSKI